MWVELVAIGISIASAFFAFRSNRYAEEANDLVKKYTGYEKKIRLQLVSENRTVYGGFGEDPDDGDKALLYEANIENAGTDPVSIVRAYLDVRRQDGRELSLRVLRGKHLQSEDQVSISKTLTWSDLPGESGWTDSPREVVLRLLYENLDGETVQIERRLWGWDAEESSAPSLFAQGTLLT